MRHIETYTIVLSSESDLLLPYGYRQYTLINKVGLSAVQDNSFFSNEVAETSPSVADRKSVV